MGRKSTGRGEDIYGPLRDYNDWGRSVVKQAFDSISEQPGRPFPGESGTDDPRLDDLEY